MGDQYQQFAQAIGLNQNAPATQTGIPSLQAPSMGAPELLFRTISAAAMPTLARLHPRTGGQLAANIGLMALGGATGALGEELGRQRLDPVSRQLAIAGQLQKMGTTAGPPEIPKLAPDTGFAMPEAGAEPQGLVAPGMPGVAAPMQVGAPRFDYNRLPTQYQIAFSKELAPLQQAKASEAAIKASEAATAYHTAALPHLEAQTQETLQDIAIKKQTQAEKARVEAANQSLRDFYTANPNATPAQLGQFASRAGADEKALEPIIKTMDATGQNDLRQAQIKHLSDAIALQKQQEGRLASQFKQEMDRRNVEGLRQIVGEQLKGTDNTIKQLQAGITNAQNVLKIPIPITATPEEKQRIEQDQADARVRLDTFSKQLPIEQQAKKEHQANLTQLFSETPLGKKIFENKPEPPPPAPIPVQFAPGTVKTLEDFLKYKRR